MFCALPFGIHMSAGLPKQKLRQHNIKLQERQCSKASQADDEIVVSHRNRPCAYKEMRPSFHWRALPTAPGKALHVLKKKGRLSQKPSHRRDGRNLSPNPARHASVTGDVMLINIGCTVAFGAWNRASCRHGTAVAPTNNSGLTVFPRC